MQTRRMAVTVALMAGLCSMRCVVVTSDCGPGLVNCGGYCADLNADETDCGGCGLSCAIGDFCSDGLCVVGSCFADGSSCSHDSQCCSDYCASDSLCGCIPTGNVGCASNADCCSNFCGRDGVCHP